MKNEFVELINAIKANPDEDDRTSDLNFADYCMMQFKEYVNTVYVYNYRMPIIYAMYEGEGLRNMVTRLDINRKMAHDSAIAACKQLNRLCSNFYHTTVFCPENTDDRYNIANFCAQVVVEIFLSGIGMNDASIDKVIDAIKHGAKVNNATATEIIEGKQKNVQISRNAKDEF